VEPHASEGVRQKFMALVRNSSLPSDQNKLQTNKQFDNRAPAFRPCPQSGDLQILINMFSDYLFLNDCKTLGIIPEECNEDAILKLLHESGQTPPRLSYEAHKILSFGHFFDGIKVDTLVIEVPLYVFQ
jgi:hypothetical protein